MPIKFIPTKTPHKFLNILFSLAFLLPVSTYTNHIDADTCDANPIPGGGKITFASERDGQYQIYVMDGSECNIQKLTDTTEFNTNPAWSPDHTQLITASGTDANDASTYRLYKMNADGSNRAPLIQDPPSGIYTYPTWSPDGAKVAFQLGRYHQDIYVVNVDGTGLRLLAHSGSTDSARPVWTPDGTQIVYVNASDIGIMNADGSGKHLIMNPTYSNEAYPSLSPDGTKVAFTTDRDNTWEVYTMNIDGTNQQRITYNDTFDWSPEWSPDGTKILFYSLINNQFDLYVVDLSNGIQTQITNSPSNDVLGVWGGPVTNHDPILDAIGPKTVDVGQQLQFSINATDEDNDILTYSVSNLPAGAAFDAVTRAFDWTPTVLDVGDHANIIFEVSDGNGGIDTESITISVLPPPGYTDGSEPVVPIDETTGTTPATITFTEVSTPGITTLVTSPQPPIHGGTKDYRIAGEYYNIETTALYSEVVTVCINYNEPQKGNGNQENNYRFLHWQDSNNDGVYSWEDITTSLDTVSNIICGETMVL